MFNIRETHDVQFSGLIPEWARDGVMAAAPYVDNHGWHILLRAYTEEKDQPVYRSCICVGDGDAFNFVIRSDAMLMPGSAGEADSLACEDPTRVDSPEYGPGVLYSQVRRIPADEMVRRGKTADELGVYVALGYCTAMDSRNFAIRTVLEPTKQTWWRSPIDMCKEGEVIVRPKKDHDILFYEFADTAASRIAVAKVDLCGRGEHAPACTAWDSQLWLDRRSGMWDCDHVSTGPIVDLSSGKKLMFYNGRNKDTFAIGEVVFDPDTLEIEYRSEQPLISPPQELGWQDQYIAFSSGAVVVDGTVYIYYHIADRRICCAVGSFK